MDDDPEIVAEHGISSAILKGFWTWCCESEDMGNSGEYGATIYIPGSMRLKSAIPAALRKGIVFYSTGSGWRVRKKPHWKEVFKERFPIHYERFNAGEVKHE